MIHESFVVGSSESGIRIDRHLSERLTPHSRNTIQKWIEEGHIKVNGKVVKPGYKLKLTDRIEIHAGEPEVPRTVLEPWDYPLEILYEDDEILAINKPAHVTVHPGAGRSSHTIAHALLCIRPEMATVGHPLRPGIVHRLDKETSGVLLTAKTHSAYRTLTTLFKERSIEKRYRAMVFGKMPACAGKIEKPLGRDPQDRKKISVRARRSRPAITLYHVLKEYAFGTLLDVRILTGRTHQIRVHLSSENHPVVGDTKYSGANWARIQDASLRTKLKASAFFGLHAYSLDFEHPNTGHPLHLEAPLPELWNFMQNK